MTCQFHEFWYGFIAEVQVSGRKKLIGFDNCMEIEVVDIQCQKNQNGKDIDELAHQGELLGCLRVKDICCGKSHLISYDSSTKVNAGKDELRGQPQ